MKNVRCFNNVYTHKVIVAPGTANNGSSPMYFQASTNLLKNKTIKAIETVTFQPVGPLTPAPWYLTLVNFNKEILLFNFPVGALSTTNETPVKGRLQLFNLFDVDINNSFWIVSGGTGWGAGVTNPYNLIFYY